MWAILVNEMLVRSSSLGTECKEAKCFFFLYLIDDERADVSPEGNQ